MKARTVSSCLVPMILCGLLAESAYASFHLMQIEQVIGGVNGDTTAQAIQLRMRSSFQNFVASARIRAFDANGMNPITVINIAANVPNGSTGDRVLITSTNFDALTSPATTPDFTMTNLIPASYLAAGSLTFESDFGTIYWRLSWGGGSYTGSTLGTTNDDNGDFGPPYPNTLPSGSTQALLFQGSAGALSTTNAANYALTPGSAAFTNNAGNSFTVNNGQGPPEACCLPGQVCEEIPPNCCESKGGTPRGPGSVCGPVVTCCLPGQICEEMAASCCEMKGGLPGPLGSVCEPPEACCLPGQVCEEIPPNCCESKGGTPRGPGSVCGPSPGCCESDADCPAKCEDCDLATNTCFDIPGCCELDADCPAKCADCDLATNTCFVPGCCAACVWDIDGSGDVRVPDLIKLLSCWGPLTGDPLCACLDIDSSGDIRVPDLIAMLAKWGLCP